MPQSVKQFIPIGVSLIVQSSLLLPFSFPMSFLVWSFCSSTVGYYHQSLFRLMIYS